MQDFDELSEKDKEQIRADVAWVDAIAREAMAKFQKRRTPRTPPNAPSPVPQNAPKCPKMPHKNANRQNEANVSHGPASAAIEQRGNLQGDPIKSPEMPRSAPKCPMKDGKMQNEPTVVMRGSLRPLSPRELTAISALFAGHSFTDTCRHLRVDRKTLFRWRRRPEFLAELDRRYAQQMRPRGRR